MNKENADVIVHNGKIATQDDQRSVVQAAAIRNGQVLATGTDREVMQLEKEMDSFNQDLAALRSFVLAGSSRLNAALDICRTVCRRAERACVSLARLESVPPEALAYLNRLSDALFVLSRWVTHVTGTPETLWEPNQSSSGRGE